jgi:hypothetical protein
MGKGGGCEHHAKVVEVVDRRRPDGWVFHQCQNAPLARNVIADLGNAAFSQCKQMVGLRGPLKQIVVADT